MHYFILYLHTNGFIRLSLLLLFLYVYIIYYLQIGRYYTLVSILDMYLLN